MSSSRAPLCVMLPEIGVASETFLRWEVEQLLPGGTVVIADPPPAGLSIVGTTTWRLGGQPALVFDPIPGDPAPCLQRQREVANFLETHHVEVVLLEYLDFADRWFDLLRTPQLRVWLRGHGVDIFARLRDPYWIARFRRFSAADGVIVPSHAAARQLESIGIDSGKIHVVAHAVDVPSRPRRHRSAAVCISVGRLVPKKAPLLTLEAFRLAHQRHPGITLDMIGDGPLVAAAHRFVEEHSLSEFVRMHGQLDHAETLRLIRHSDLLLHHAMTSPEDGDSEGQPLVILEAMAAGLAVISTQHAGIPEVITDGDNGRLVDEGDVEAMSRQIIELSARPTERARLGSSARRALTASHTPQHVRQCLLRLLGLSPQHGGQL